MEGIESFVSEKLRHASNSSTSLSTTLVAAWGVPFDEFPESGWDKVMDLDVTSLFFLTQKFAPLLRASATAGATRQGH